MPVAWGISYKERIYGMDPDVVPDVVPKCFWTVFMYLGKRDAEGIVGRDNDIKSVFNAIKNIEDVKEAIENNINELEACNNIRILIGRVNTLLSKARNRRRFNVMFYCLAPMISHHFFESKEECEDYIEKFRYSFDVDPKPFLIKPEKR